MNRLLMAVLPSLVLSACAEPNLVGDLNKRCDDRIAAGTFRPHRVIYGFSGGRQINGFSTAYDPMVGRFNLKAIDCARAHPAQPPHSYDLDKIGGAPDPGGAAMISGNWKPCPASRV